MNDMRSSMLTLFAMFFRSHFFASSMISPEAFVGVRSVGDSHSHRSWQTRSLTFGMSVSRCPDLWRQMSFHKLVVAIFCIGDKLSLVPCSSRSLS